MTREEGEETWHAGGWRRARLLFSALSVSQTDGRTDAGSAVAWVRSAGAAALTHSIICRMIQLGKKSPVKSPSDVLLLIKPRRRAPANYTTQRNKCKINGMAAAAAALQWYVETCTSGSV